MFPHNKVSFDNEFGTMAPADNERVLSCCLLYLTGGTRDPVQNTTMIFLLPKPSTPVERALGLHFSLHLDQEEMLDKC